MSDIGMGQNTAKSIIIDEMISFKKKFID